jgi:5-methylcytosine-specific restriction endonuclease McrA
MNEKKKEYMKRYREENKEKISQQTKAYREKNNDWLKENKRKCDANRRASGKVKEWESKNKDKRNKYNETYLLKLNLANKNISYRTLSAWSLQVKERDCSCLYCGSTDKLHAHHILSKIKHPEFALFLNNGITLCESCHINEHQINGNI